jgi:hypothetical protein
MNHDAIEKHQVIERYVLGRLPEAEAVAFEDHYLRCPECLRQLELAERFQQGLRDTAAEDLGTALGSAAVLAGLARRRWAALALAVVVAVALAVLAVRQSGGALEETRARLAKVESRRAAEARRAAAAEREAAGLRDRLARESEARGRLEAELVHERRPRAGAAWVVTLVPVRSGPAAGETVQRIALPPSPEWIVLTLDLELARDVPYRMTLRRRDGAVVWTADKLMAGPDGTLALGLDSALLPPGDYRLLVESAPPGQTPFPVSRFAFRAVAPR